MRYAGHCLRVMLRFVKSNAMIIYMIILWDKRILHRQNCWLKKTKHNQVANVQGQNNSFSFERLQTPDAYLPHFATLWIWIVQYSSIFVRFVHIRLSSIRTTSLVEVLPYFLPSIGCAMLCQGTVSPPAFDPSVVSAAQPAASSPLLLSQATPWTRHCNCCWLQGVPWRSHIITVSYSVYTAVKVRGTLFWIQGDLIDGVDIGIWHNGNLRRKEIDVPPNTKYVFGALRCKKMVQVRTLYPWALSHIPKPWGAWHNSEYCAWYFHIECVCIYIWYV